MSTAALDTSLPHDFQHDISAIESIAAVPSILEVVCRTTGMGFAAVARVTSDRWIACGVRDDIAFGLAPGGELKVETTICNEIRQTREPVIIDHVSVDPDFAGHPTPALYGFQSYISMPIIRADGSFFGTLCAIDPRPVLLRTPQTIAMFKLFAFTVAVGAAALVSASYAGLVRGRTACFRRAAWSVGRGGDIASAAPSCRRRCAAPWSTDALLIER